MKRIGLLVILLVAILATVGSPAAAQTATATPAPVTSPGGWDEAICNGSEGVVFRTVNATTSDLPASEGCLLDEEMGWVLVEPWARESNELNPDRACFADDWTTIRLVTSNNGWTEGSVWRVANSFEENPLVVNCADVASRGQLGINPYEGQIELRTMKATLARAMELLSLNGYTMTTYLEEFGDTPFSELFVLVQLLGMGAG